MVLVVHAAMVRVAVRAMQDREAMDPAADRVAMDLAAVAGDQAAARSARRHPSAVDTHDKGWSHVSAETHRELRVWRKTARG
jgi:hypothetical protein